MEELKTQKGSLKKELEKMEPGEVKKVPACYALSTVKVTCWHLKKNGRIYRISTKTGEIIVIRLK